MTMGYNKNTTMGYNKNTTSMRYYKINDYGI